MLKTIYWLSRGARALLRRAPQRVSTALSRAVLQGLGHGSVVQFGVRFDRPASVSIGHSCLIWRGVGVAAEGHEASLCIGDRVQINRDVLLDTTGGMRLGDDVVISEGALLYTHDHGLDPHAEPTLWPKNIDAGAWVGARAIILPNCQNVGAGAVIGAGAIVTKDVPSGAIVAGNPARIIGRRPSALVAA